MLSLNAATKRVEYRANNLNDIQYFYRVVLLLDEITPVIGEKQLLRKGAAAAASAGWIYIIYRNTIRKLGRYPRSPHLL